MNCRKDELLKKTNCRKDELLIRGFPTIVNSLLNRILKSLGITSEAFLLYDYA